MIERRTLGGSPVEVTTLGLGCGPIGGLFRSLAEPDAQATLATAFAAGIRYFDVAPLYGHGRSESRLGAFLASLPDDTATVSTKVGRLLVLADRPDFDRHGYVDTPALMVRFDYSRDGVRRSLEASRARLGRERIDLVLVHDIDRRTHGAEQPARLREALDGALPTLLEARERCEIGAVGLGVNETDVAEAVIRALPIDAVLLAGRWTLLEQSPARAFLPLCLERRGGVIVGGPYNSGILATGAVAGARYDYAPAPAAILARTRELEAALAAHRVALRDAALHFPLTHPAVVSVIPGLMTVAEVADTLASWRRPIDPDVWADLARRGLIDVS